ncbi:putative membrane protein [Acetoanaerobium pronyense]|uniref:Membrane protein n=1 Tax=Acetoanaerobium pronyense TaxID=1482736 RepID=A0ABS4KEU3_9FIRM|nr:ECF transporter S component [Acetoanaerobium pronyense]MBP2026290.1 putative membrane protein [Acetoanaerobium pronyense]
MVEVKKKTFSVRHMAVTGMLGAISVILGMTPLGFIPVGPTNATIMHIPVIIGAIVEGPIVGMAVGLIFGIFSLIRSITTPTPVSFVFWNPLVSILPRILIGLVSYYVYKGTFKITKNETVSFGITGALGTLTNTLGVLGMVYILYAERFVSALGMSGEKAFTVISSIGIANGLPEMFVAMLIVTAAVKGIKKIKK